MEFNVDDLGFGSSVTTQSSTSNEDKTDLTTGQVTTEVAGGEKGTNIDDNHSNDKGDNTSSTGTASIEKEGEKATDKTDDIPNQLPSGTEIEIDDTTYIVDTLGNLVDDKGNIFKEAKDVDAFLKEFKENEENANSIDIETIQKTIGIEVTDENGKPIEFDSTPEGVAAYVNSVIELKQEEFAEAGVNKLLQTYPIVSDVLNYYVANGNSLDGFGEIKDRTGIVIDDANIAQHEAIIRESFKEFGKRGDVESYIKYLKDSDQLLNVAKEELSALQQADADFKQENARKAAEVAAAQEQELIDYWNGVKETIDKREIAGYKIPDTMIVERDGKKIPVTPDDFFKYLYEVNDEGLSRYNVDLSKETREQRRDDEILRAYLKFTGKNYNSLMEMAIADKEVKRLKLVSANRTSKQTIKIKTPGSNNKKELTGNDLGFN